MDETTAGAEKFDCPVAWCTGLQFDHGGDGADPDSWMHTGPARELDGAIATATKVQYGSGLAEWVIYFSAAPNEAAASLALAERFRATAAAVERLCV